MKRFFFILIFLAGWSIASGDDGYKRNRSIDITHYDFSISVSDSSNIIIGHSSIFFNSLSSLTQLELDFQKIDSGSKGMKVSNVVFNNGMIKWKHENDKITIIFENPLAAGSQGVLTIDYSGIPSDGLIISENKFGDRTFFADNWPNRAHCWLPCIDHPYEKASVDFMVTCPEHYEVVGNGYLAEESIMPGHTRFTHWKETVPVSMKVMAIGVAPFASRYEGSIDGVQDWTWVFTENRTEGFSDYSVALKPLAYFSQLIGKYPFEKLANVQSKTVYGGMENAGCIFYAESSVTGQGKAESLIAHEIAHQWFGNSVTENDWHHIWLSEGFATYLAACYLEKAYGRARLDETMKSARDQVLRYFPGLKVPVVDTTVTNLLRLLNANSYQKGAWVLHMLRHELGDDLFWKGLRSYYEKYHGSNVLTIDFEKAMEEAGKRDLSGFFRQWLFTPGVPELRIRTVASATKGTTDVVVEQTQEHLFIFNLEVRIRDKNSSRIISIPVSERQTIKHVETENILEIVPDPDTNLLFRML